MPHLAKVVAIIIVGLIVYFYLDLKQRKNERL